MYNKIALKNNDPATPDEPQEKVAVPSKLSASEWVKERLGFEPDATQTRILESKAKRGILNCTRQWGKSTVTAAMAVHHAYTNAKSLTLVASPGQRQSSEFVMKAEGFVRQLGIAAKGDGSNEASIMLPNGSRIVGLPGTEATVRGFSAVSLLLIDEASRVDDALYHALRPMLATTNGTMWLMSTPWGQSGFFYEAWFKGGPIWERVEVRAEECPRISKEFLDEARLTHTRTVFEREYGCGFEDAGGSVFNMAMVRQCLSWDVKPLFPGT